MQLFPQDIKCGICKSATCPGQDGQIGGYSPSTGRITVANDV